MAYSATVIPVMIASPGDVSEERNLIRDILHEWNDLNSMQANAVLLPVGWDTHSSPELGARPQSLINKHVLDQCDLLDGVFWTRIGTPTGDAESGTAEEIRRHVEAGKPAMVYFSTAPVAPQSLDQNQYQKLTKFKKWFQTQGLTEEYDNLSAFSDKFRRQVQIKVRENSHLKQLIVEKRIASDGDHVGSEVSNGELRDWGSTAVRLTEEAKKLLIEATKDRSGTIMSVRYLGGQAIQTNSINFTDSADRRSIARWEAALQQLCDSGSVTTRGHKREVFEVTDMGYTYVDNLQAS